MLPTAVQESTFPTKVHTVGAEWGYLCSTVQFPSTQREIFIQILMCTLGSLFHNRLLLDWEYNSSSETVGLKENISIAINLMHVI